jgi:hypothetical protein
MEWPKLSSSVSRSSRVFIGRGLIDASKVAAGPPR